MFSSRKMTVITLCLLVAGGTSFAALSAVSPTLNINAFPDWYQDSLGLQCDQCIALTLAEVPFCGSLGVWLEDENFYWSAFATVTLSDGAQADLILALESAYLNGPLTPGEEITFGRVRIQINNPTAGTYTITHPYGTDTLVATAGQARARLTRDIGGGIAGDFVTALGSDIGPFLQSTAGFIPGPQAGKLYFGDGITPVTVTGSPAGNNLFRVAGPASGETNLFTLTGRLFITPTSPLALNDAATTAGVPVDINLLANDIPLAGTTLDPVSVLVTQPANGVVTVDPLTGIATYTQNPGFVGIDVFTYTVADNLGAISNTATVSVEVTNAPPVAVNDTATANVNTAVVIPVVANDTDIDGTINPASVAIVAPPLGGSVLVNQVTGAVEYTPNVNFSGADSFTYTVNDNLGAASNIATANITVNVPATATGGVAGALSTITVTRATFTTRTGRWSISGTTTVSRDTLTFRVGPDFTGPIIGVDIAGAVSRRTGLARFSIAITNRNAPADLTKTLSIQSANGTLFLNVPVTVR